MSTTLASPTGARLSTFSGASLVGSSSGFIEGFAIGAIKGAFIGGIGAALNGGDVGKGMLYGSITGGITAGSRAHIEGDANFWTGNKTLDTSQGVGAHTPDYYVFSK